MKIVLIEVMIRYWNFHDSIRDYELNHPLASGGS